MSPESGEASYASGSAAFFRWSRTRSRATRVLTQRDAARYPAITSLG